MKIQTLLVGSLWVAWGCGPSDTGSGTASGTATAASDSSTSGSQTSDSSTNGSQTSDSSTSGGQTSGGTGNTSGGAGGSTSATSASNGGVTTGSLMLPCPGGTQSCTPSPAIDSGASPAAFTLVDPYLYWKDTVGLRRKNLDTAGAAETIVAGATAFSMGANTTHVFITTDQNTVARVPVTGGALEVIWTHSAQLLDIEADNELVFFNDVSAGAYALPVAGGSLTALVQGSPLRVEFFGNDVYVLGRGLQVAGTSVDGVVKVPRTGGAPEVVYQGLVAIEIMPTDAGLYLMFTDHVELAVVGQAPATVYQCGTSGVSSCGGIAYDDDYLYVSDNEGDFSSAISSWVARVPRSGGTPEVLARHTSGLFSIRAYKDQLFFAQVAGGVLSSGKCPCE